MLDWAPQVAKQWMLSRFIAVFESHGKGAMVESFASRSRAPVDAIDLAIIRALSAKDLQSAAELADRIGGTHKGIHGAEVVQRLEALASIAVVSSQGGDPPIWWSLDSTRRQTPFIDFVEITNHCGARCVMCRAAQGFMERPRGFMSVRLFERILSMIGPRPHLKPLILHNAGDPLLHPHLLTMVALARKAGIPTEISTNAGLLSLDTYKGLCEAGIARIVIALDGTDVETLGAIRGRGVRPQDALTNIEALLSHRVAERSTLPALVLQMVQMRANAHQHSVFRERYGRLGLPGVSAFLKPVEAPADSPLLMPGVDRPQTFCSAPWQTLGIYWDGRVVPCCYDLNASLCVGDVNDQTLMEIWCGEAMVDLRERIKADRCSPRELCHSCHNRPDRYQRPDLSTIPEIPDDWR